jgi:uncharacterized protein (TIGR02453 family)
MAFSGWPPQAAEFFKGLEADNTKAYWTAHKAVYETLVREPMAALLDELSGEFGPGRIARPYRDIRFRADKSPYKTEIYAALDRGGYVRFSADGLMAANGSYQLTPGQLERYRRAVADDAQGARLAALVQRLRSQGIEAGGGQTLKSAPRGYPRDHPRAELLRYKGVICWRHWPAGPWLATPEAKDRVVALLRAAAPLRQWLDQQLGPGHLVWLRR